MCKLNVPDLVGKKYIVKNMNLATIKKEIIPINSIIELYNYEWDKDNFGCYNVKINSAESYTLPFKSTFTEKNINMLIHNEILVEQKIIPKKQSKFKTNDIVMCDNLYEDQVIAKIKQVIYHDTTNEYLYYLSILNNNLDWCIIDEYIEEDDIYNIEYEVIEKNIKNNKYKITIEIL